MHTENFNNAIQYWNHGEKAVKFPIQARNLMKTYVNWKNM